MGVIWTPDSGKPPFGDLGASFYLDPTGKSGWDVNDPNSPAYLYRIVFDDGNYLYSPYGFGKKRQQWGKKATEVPDDDSDEDDDYGDDYDDDDDYDSPPPSLSLEDRIRWNFDRLSDGEKSLLQEDDLDANAIELLRRKLMRGVNGDTGGLGKGGVIIDPFGGDPRRTVLWNAGPHIGFSAIGVPHGLFSLPQRVEYQNPDGDMDKDKVMLANALNADFIAGQGKEYAGEDLLDSFGNMARATIEKLKDIVPSRAVRSRLEDTMKRKWLRGYMPSTDFFNRLGSDSEHGGFWKDFMHDNIVRLLEDTLYYTSHGARGDSRDKFRVVQAAVKLNDLVSNDMVRRGEHSGQRDGMNEFVAFDYVPFKDFGGASRFLGGVGKGSGLFQKYHSLRARGLSGEDAWKEAFTDKNGNPILGDIRKLISDEDRKNVYKDCRSDIDNYLSRQNIVGALKRSPGNG